MVSSTTPSLGFVAVTRCVMRLNQLLVKDFTIDSITVPPMQTTFAPGADYMADYDEWLFIQVSGETEHRAHKRDACADNIRSWELAKADRCSNYGGTQ